MKIGLVGKPNVGKSTMFAALTQINVEIANYPFTTIDPNVGITLIRARHDCPAKLLREKIEKSGRKTDEIKCSPRTGSCENNLRYVPVTLVDVAGLVPGAHEGKGRGNQFLSDLSQCDALIQVIDASCSTDLSGNPVGKSECDPIEEHEFLISELASWILGIINNGWLRGVRRVQSEGDKGLINYLFQTLTGIGAKENQIIIGFNKFKTHEDTSTPWDWSEEKKHRLALELRESIFPLYVAANKADIANNEDLEKLINVEKLKISNCKHINNVNIFGIDNIKSKVKVLDISFNQELLDINNLYNLNELNIIGLQTDLIYISNNMNKFDNTIIYDKICLCDSCFQLLPPKYRYYYESKKSTIDLNKCKYIETFNWFDYLV